MEHTTVSLCIICGKVELFIACTENVTYLAGDTKMWWDDSKIFTEQMTQFRREVVCPRFNKNVAQMMVTVALIQLDMFIVQSHVSTLLNNGITECLPC
jgi:hypothetical protein